MVAIPVRRGAAGGSPSLRAEGMPASWRGGRHRPPYNELFDARRNTVQAMRNDEAKARRCPDGYPSRMNAAPLLALVSQVLVRHRLDAVVIGNAAAALQGSPVTTMDVDFMFRQTPTNLRKLKAVADDLEAMVLRPYYPASALFRVVRDRDGLQLDFMAKVDGVRSFEALKARATPVRFGRSTLLVASLRDIIRSKERAGRPQDLAVLPVLRKTLDEQEARKASRG